MATTLGLAAPDDVVAQTAWNEAASFRGPARPGDRAGDGEAADRTQQADLDGLDKQRATLETALKTQRAALAALLRSAYALGRNEELKLLLQQNDVAAIARVLAYNRYFERARIGRIDRLSIDLEDLAKVQASIRQATAALAATRASRASEGDKLESERSERETAPQTRSVLLICQARRPLGMGLMPE